MLERITLFLVCLGAFGLSAVEVQKIEKIEKYMGSCDIVDYDVRAHMTYVLETGYEDDYSNKGVIVEFGDEKGNLVRLTDKIKRLNITGFEKEVKIKNRWRSFSVDKDKNRFGGSDGELEINKITRTGEIEYQYRCYQGSNCGEYEIELELKNCKLDYTLNGKKIN